MKKQAWAALMLTLVLFLCAISFAEDYIEIKGRGILSGKVIKEEADQITFKGPDGISQVIPRSQITMLQKDLAKDHSAPPPQAPVALFQTPSSLPSARSVAGSAIVSRSRGITMDQLKQALAERARARAESKDVTTKINLWIEGVYTTQLLFMVPDAEAFGKAIMETVDRAQKKEGGAPYGIAGLILAIIGVLGLGVSGVMVIIQSFRCGVRWGLLILTNGIVTMMAARFGETMILIGHLWPLFMMYFMITRFQVMRKPTLFSMLSLMLIFAALVIVRIGFVSV